MRYSQAEKMEIVRLVESSEVSVQRTLKELGINRSTFYKWYQRYVEDGYDGLAYKYQPPRQFWNAIPPGEREKVVEIALDHPEKSPRELACHITDTQEYYVSESSVYRIFRERDLVTSPIYTVMTAADKFFEPTRGINELWQTDFTYLKVVGWGWYYLSTVMDDYSRYILAWRLCRGMSTDEVKETIDEAIQFTGVRHVRIIDRPRLLSDNGPCYVSKAFEEYLGAAGMSHVRCKPYHPMTQGKIERYHRSMKNIIRLTNYNFPSELEEQIQLFVSYYNHERYHEALGNVTPADVYYGRDQEIKARRELIRKKTMQLRRAQNCALRIV
jgi:transposase InsO family protein/transposase-like protein